MFYSDDIPFFKTDLEDQTVTPLSEGGLPVGSTSHSSNSIKPQLDLNSELITSPASTFFARVQDESKNNDGDLLIIDKSIVPYDGCMIVAFVDGEFRLKRVKVDAENITWLVSANKDCKPIIAEADNEHTVWGVVKYLIKKV